jgi:hypothetical protein
MFKSRLVASYVLRFIFLLTDGKFWLRSLRYCVYSYSIWTRPSPSAFNEAQIRQHLYHCLEAGHLTLFPHRKIAVQARGSDDIKVYCKCRMPEIEGVPMRECSKCSEWFHASCEQVPSEILDFWICSSCHVLKYHLIGVVILSYTMYTVLYSG